MMQNTNNKNTNTFRTVLGTAVKKVCPICILMGLLILAILFRPFDFIAPKTLKIILLSNLQILSVSDERFCSNLQILNGSPRRLYNKEF
jgi:hypothetical protein